MDPSGNIYTLIKGDATYDPRDRILKAARSLAGVEMASDATYDPRDRILKESIDRGRHG